MLADFRAVIESEEYNLALSWFVFGILRELDLPDIAGSLAPKPCWLINVTGAKVELLPQLTVKDRFQNAFDHCAKGEVAHRLQLIVQLDGEPGSTLERWLEQS
jgi:hypothetical protein